MKKTLRNSLVATAAGGAALALPALAFGVATGSGASFPATAYSKWCQDSGLCSYTSKGSTGGINDLINGVVNFAASDAPLTAQQTSDLAAKRGGVTPLYFPTLIGTITVDTNIDGISKGINFDGKTLADIFRGAISNWSDARIRKPNPGVTFPNAPITLCVRSDGSGHELQLHQLPVQGEHELPGRGGREPAAQLADERHHRREGRAQPRRRRLRQVEQELGRLRGHLRRPRRRASPRSSPGSARPRR